METAPIRSDKLSHVPTTVRRVIEQMRARLAISYGDSLKEVILYGSYARGDYTEESDIDLLIVLKDEELSKINEINRLVKLKSDLMIENRIIISTKAITAVDYQNRPNAIYHFIKKEGIRV